MSESDAVVPGDDVVLVEFVPRPGLQEVALTPRDVAIRSTEAIDSAMSTIRSMADRVSTAAREAKNRPTKVEVTFGLKLDAEAGAFIAKTGIEAGISVAITWESKQAT
jgi:hypothetical protein